MKVRRFKIEWQSLEDTDDGEFCYHHEVEKQTVTLEARVVTLALENTSLKIKIGIAESILKEAKPMSRSRKIIDNINDYFQGGRRPIADAVLTKIDELEAQVEITEDRNDVCLKALSVANAKIEELEANPKLDYENLKLALDRENKHIKHISMQVDKIVKLEIENMSIKCKIGDAESILKEAKPTSRIKIIESINDYFQGGRWHIADAALATDDGALTKIKPNIEVEN